LNDDCLDIDAVRPGDGSECEEEEGAVVEATVGEHITVVREDDKVKQVPDTWLPTARGIEMHGLTHVPYRTVCSVCIAGRGRDLDQLSRKFISEESGLPKFASDSCFPGDEFGYRLMILVGR
jgi:hypothetical protein